MITRGLIVASARLPVALAQHQQRWEAEPSPGGLVTALVWVARSRQFRWFGWPGTYVPEAAHDEVRAELARHGSEPVFIAQGDIEGFHQSFSNQTLWPLFHNRVNRTRFDVGGWESYRAVNEAFADAIAAAVSPSDVIWVHDYQLTLVPAMLRRRGMANPIGFCLHIPFPSTETYRNLPEREPVLEGMLGADLIGFHTHEYATNFRAAAVRVLGADLTQDGIRLGGRRTRVAALPIGIDPDEITRMRESREARQELASLQTTYAGRKIIVGVDRFDYTKGIVEKLRAFELLLETQPRWRQRVVLIQVAAPSRMTVSEYQQLKREVDELVGRINGRYGSSSFMPVVYVNQSVSRERLTGLYRAADVALITPVRDGMNLVALEYVAARAERGGTLILSEFTGAAHCLPGARLVNPYNTAQLAQTLATCLEHPCTSSEQFRHMLRFVLENTASAWAERFLGLLEQSVGEARLPPEKLALRAASELERIRAARRPLVLLGDGALQVAAAGAAEGAPDARSLRMVRALSTQVDTYVVSSRTSQSLTEWFGSAGTGLVSEHSLALRAPGGEWESLYQVELGELRNLVDPLLGDFVRLTPGSAVEYRASGAIWHIQSAESDHANLQARELLALLEDRLRGKPYTVHRCRRSVEIRPRGLSKAEAVARILGRHPDADWVLVAGDDISDDAMLRAVKSSEGQRVLVCAVGACSLGIGAWVESPDVLLDEIESLIEVRQGVTTGGQPAGAAAADPEATGESVSEPESSPGYGSR